MIEFESVTKRYRDGTTAVRDLSLRIPSDQITVLVGPSGCGKTTSLRMINRMLEPTRGRILWDEKPIKSLRRTKLRRQMGYVIQSGGLFPHRTVVENISTVPGLLRWNKAKTQARAYELLEMVGLERRLVNRYPAQLSGGQQQRVGVARALAADPIVMLMDEPFSAVDPVVRADLHDQFLQLQQQIGKTIVLITHDIDEAINIGDQVAILRVGGQLAQAGTPQQLLDEPADEFVEGFVGKDRGYRGLSFVPASGLRLDSVRAVRDPAAASGNEPVLVVGENAKPVGWADRSRPGQVLGLGTTFNPETDAMRAALDSALTSPVGLAVAVSANGRYSGVATAGEILDHVRNIRASIADAISERATDDTQDQAGSGEPVTAADDNTGSAEPQEPDASEGGPGPEPDASGQNGTAVQDANDRTGDSEIPAESVVNTNPGAGPVNPADPAGTDDQLGDDDSDYSAVPDRTDDKTMNAGTDTDDGSAYPDAVTESDSPAQTEQLPVIEPDSGQDADEQTVDAETEIRNR